MAGEVYVWRLSDDPMRFAPGARLMHANGREVVVESARVHRDRFLVKFAGSDSREEAEMLRGELFVRPTDVRDLGPDEFWPHDLVGCDVVLVDGRLVGRVLSVTGGPAQDLLTVSTSLGDRLIPLVQAIVVEVDVGARRILIDPPEGLLD
ncbi:MAG: rRNA processing protein RimM [Actinomycetota bacterium]|jgi:16S rRNA processing protein RimM|nr:rRNA processing protein RimM [Actinomycetota bacterium]